MRTQGHRARAVGVCGARVVGLQQQLPGKPHPESRELRPEEVKDFAELYGHNCSGCHGPEGKGGAALALANPVYLAIADEETLRRVTSNGVPGTAMPAFARQAGGRLTDDQIDVLVREIRSRWSRPDALGGATPPAYRADAAGEPARGEADISDLLRLVPRPGRQGRTEGQLDRRRIVPRAGERPGPAHHGDCRAARPRPAGLARLCRRPIAVEPGRVRRRRLARLAAARDIRASPIRRRRRRSPRLPQACG